jgi:hypothetical protein
VASRPIGINGAEVYHAIALNAVSRRSRVRGSCA